METHALHNIMAFAQQNNTKELSQISSSKIWKAIHELWPRHEEASGIVHTLMKVGTKSDWFNHFHKLAMNSKMAREERVFLDQLSSDMTQNLPGQTEDDIHEAIALEIVNLSPDLLYHRQETNSGMTVVHLCAAYGCAKLFVKLLALAKSFPGDQYIQPFKIKDNRGETPLSLALNKLDSGNEAIAIVEALLQQTDVDVHSASWIPANYQHQGNAMQDIHVEQLLLLMKHRAACMNDQLIKCAMSHDKLFESLLDIDDIHAWHGNLLFLAVEISSIRAVERLLERFPRLSVMERENKSVLRLVSEIVDGADMQKAMRAVIVPHVIRQVEEETRFGAERPKTTPRLSFPDTMNGDCESRAAPLSTTQKIRVLLADNPDTKTEDQPASGETHVSPKHPTLSVEFESTLSFVDIPIPDLPQVREDHFTGAPTRDEAQRILRWLYDQKQVTGIYELRVRDSLFIPHSEQVIKSCLDKFNIEVLDWERLDLSLEPLRDTCKNLKHLTLYGSSWSSLQYWTSEEVIALFDSIFTKIRKVTIVVITDLIGKELSEVYKDNANNRLDGLLSKTPCSPCSRFNICREVFQVETKPWPSLKHPDDSGSSMAQITAIQATRLTEFLPKYNILQRAFADLDWLNDLQIKPILTPYIKIAIIDTGVDPSCIKCTSIRGASFIPSGRGGGESPWWFSQNSHGTQVAKIITEIDPWCKLLVAKVGDGYSDMTTQRVTEAFRWAIECRADIISISATVRKSEKLKEVVNDAISAGILVLSSTTGEGYVDEEAWPANFESVMKIGAAKATGKETKGSIRANADYMFPGSDILVSTSFFGSQPFKDEVSGTSFATAIAAGVASLTLACRWLALSTQSDVTGREAELKFRRETVQNVFGKMSANEGKYVKPWIVFQQDKGQPSWGEADSILDWVRTKFLERED
ncbi:hypothetical protein FDECE_12057 [Fusarium decemcellulare]|nr:hypothetical protein FDECE_12057 [Fusarium decemcellulare]